MNELEITPPTAFTATAGAAERVTAFLRKVYGWMFVGLGITAAVAFAIASSPQTLNAIATNRGLFWGLWIVPIGLALFLQFRVHKLQPGTAALIFVIYAGAIGAWLAPLILIYTGTSIATTFVVTGGMFGALALWGTTTKRSLAGWGQFLFMGFIGVFLATLVSALWGRAGQHAGLQFVITVVGVIVFTGLAAYNAQQMKVMAMQVPVERQGSYAVVGALILYITFVNLFLMMLRILGGRRH